jgi:phospholipid/cholesterol/gamma-HCH transport system ATP-binding protein
VMDPELVFLDEPTAGLDAKSASDMDNLVLELRDRLGITIFMITHDLDTLWRVADRVIFLGEGKVLAATSMSELIKEKHPLIRDYFSGARAYPREAAMGKKNE